MLRMIQRVQCAGGKYCLVSHDDHPTADIDRLWGGSQGQSDPEQMTTMIRSVRCVTMTLASYSEPMPAQKAKHWWSTEVTETENR